jgi:NTE family protein
MRALVLSGGGSKGSFQLGALKKWMAEDLIEYDIFCGISVGSINSAYLAQFPYGDPKGAWEKLNGVWERVTSSNIKKSWFPFGILSSVWKTSVYNSKPLQKWVLSELDAKAIQRSGKKLRVISVSWNNATTHIADETDSEIAKWVIASSSFPVMLNHIEINGEQWSDGGLRSVTPLGEAIRLGADDIDVIMCSDPGLFPSFDPKTKAIPGRLLRSLDILTAQIEIADLKICGYKNDLAELRPEYKKVKIRVLKPKEILTDDSLSFDQDDIKRMTELGYKGACELVSG